MRKLSEETLYQRQVCYRAVCLYQEKFKATRKIAFIEYVHKIYKTKGKAKTGFEPNQNYNTFRKYISENRDELSKLFPH